MAFLTLVVLYSTILGAVGDGTFYNCSKLSAASETDPAKIALAQEKCTDTYWCVWETSQRVCTYDFCLRYVADDDDTSCVTGSTQGGLTCGLFYAVDSVNCTSGADLQTNRYCRVNTGYERKIILGADCFYEDLKSINGQTDGASRACGTKICSWNDTSGYGKFCEVGGGEDCSTYTEYSDICPCLGKDHCDLYPRCIVSSGNCVPDPCNDATPSTQVAGGACQFNVSPAPNCKSRIEWTYTEAGGLQQTLFCTNASTTPNECYFAVKATLKTPTQADGIAHPECVYTEYDESICNQAKVLDESINPPGVPATDAKDCQLVDIAAGYFSASKYCTDGDRTVPSPSGASLAHVPVFLAFLALVLNLFL